MTFRSLSGESVIVVMDANRNRGSNVDALDWALNHVVRPKDTVIVIGILCEFGKAKHPSSSSCFPFYTGIGISAIWERLEFSGQGEMTPQVLEVEIAKKREQYQCTLQPFYRQCNKNEVKLEVKLAAGFDPRKITIEEAHNCNTRWIVLDSHLKKHKSFIYEHAGCNVAAMKEKDVATISLARAAEFERITRKSVDMEEDVNPAVQPDNKTVNEVSNTILQGEKLGTSPLSWRTGFPRVCTEVEIESMTNGFASENVIHMEENLQVYQGIHLQAPVLVKRFFNNDERFWLELKTLSRVRHRNISNLVGYCCSDTSMFLIRDYSYIESLEVHLQRNELAKNLNWKARLNIAQDIGSCLRYLQEECLDGPIMLLSVSSSHVLFSHGCSMMLTEFTKSANHWSGYSPADRKHFMTRSPDWESKEGDEHHSLHVHAYGLFLMELLTGRSIHSYEDVQSMIEWAIPVLESGYLSQIVDPRLVDSSSDAKEVRDLASAVLMCLKNDHGHLSSVSEVLAAVRGDRFGSLHF